MILNFDQLNNQLYLLEKEFQEFIILALNIEPNEELSYDFIVRTIRLYTYTIRDCRKSLDGEEGFIHLEHFKPPETEPINQKSLSVFPSYLGVRIVSFFVGLTPCFKSSGKIYPYLSFLTCVIFPIQFFSHEILILYWPNSLFFWKENY
jgi:hypothetical protein